MNRMSQRKNKEPAKLDSRSLAAGLLKYGLSAAESRVYIFLLRQSAAKSVLEISRGLNLGRTPVYNALAKLAKKSLINQSQDSNGAIFSAADPGLLEHYQREKIRRQRELADSLPLLVETLASLSTASPYKSEVNYFQGRRGLEQLTDSSLKAKDDLYIYEIYTNMDNFISKPTSEHFRQIWVEKSTTIHQLTNLTSFEDFTEVERLITDLWDIRHISPETLDIKFEQLIYNDIVALYSPVGNDLFGVEIRNKNLASQQIQIFKAIQNLAVSLEITSPRGAARLPS
jgi:sugar-specific transcriptional regulator TrmB